MGNSTEKEFVIVMHFKGHVEIVCPVCHLNVLREMSELTPEKVTAFLNRRTGGFGCSICDANEWQMGVSDKRTDRIELRCGHCGHVVLFDRGFLENSVDDLTKGQTQANRIRRIFGW